MKNIVLDSFNSVTQLTNKTTMLIAFNPGGDRLEFSVGSRIDFTVPKTGIIDYWEHSNYFWSLDEAYKYFKILKKGSK